MLSLYISIYIHNLPKRITDTLSHHSYTSYFGPEPNSLGSECRKDMAFGLENGEVEDVQCFWLMGFEALVRWLREFILSEKVRTRWR